MRCSRIPLLVLLASLIAIVAAPGDAAAADCLDTERVDWTLPDAPVGPAWSAMSAGSDLFGNNRPFAFSVWRRPCGADNRYAQVLLSFDRQSGVPSIGRFSVRQHALDLGLADFVSNKDSVLSNRRMLLAGFFLTGDISGVVEPVHLLGPAFDPRLPFELVHVPLVTGGSRPDIVINVPAYRAADYPDSTTPYVIGASTTGTWWNAAQSGHGLTVEVLAGGVVSVIWFVYNDDRSQAWIGGAATAVGNSVTIAAVKPVGAQFPPRFLPADVRREAWGNLRLTFSDCRHGVFEYQKLGTSIWERIEITRLTQPLAGGCQ